MNWKQYTTSNFFPFNKKQRIGRNFLLSHLSCAWDEGRGEKRRENTNPPENPLSPSSKFSFQIPSFLSYSAHHKHSINVLETIHKVKICPLATTRPANLKAEGSQ
ncbi:hypothetical protein MLD38_025551 [Melastoma candidum]|uniref:Uncharacterized protein n=1 Tax=Melastoma candidum TaxID=119954 RepID=A0ACB9NYL8_9MYRT|nr:hypothetical protein MLD38_025551 [Melastoma candidum]